MVRPDMWRRCRDRYQYDPNPRVRDAMGAIWRALVAEPRAAVEENWDAIAGELLKEIGGRLWRNREAACLGLADLLQARDSRGSAAGPLFSLCRQPQCWTAVGRRS